jgi:hypothetical protein
MYIKINNGVPENYTIGQLRKDNPQTSFPSQVPESLLAEYGVFKLETTLAPTVGFDKNVTEGIPKLVDNVWKQTWTVTKATNEEYLAKVLFARANEYPPITDYLDGVVKGNQAQIQSYIDACLAVKAKYPKPVGEVNNG